MLGTRIAALRREAGLSQAELAQRRERPFSREELAVLFAAMLMEE